MDPTFLIKIVTDLGVGVGIAALALYWLKTWADQRMTEQKAYAENERADKLRMTAALEQVATATASLTEVVRTVQRVPATCPLAEPVRRAARRKGEGADG